MDVWGVAPGKTTHADSVTHPVFEPPYEGVRLVLRTLRVARNLEGFVVALPFLIDFAEDGPCPHMTHPSHACLLSV
jgi:hypothetical protein